MKINLIVEFERTNGTIVETYVGGDLISIANASIDFHFSKTDSVLGLVEFGVEYADGSANLTVHPDKGSMITVQFSEHGCLLYTSPSPRDRTRSRMPSSA